MMQTHATIHKDFIPGGSLDSRTRSAGRDEQLERLANSIKRRGLIQPIVGRLVGKKVQIIAGNRRHAAIGLLIESGDWDANQPIITMIREVDDATAFEDSIAENVERRKLGALEEYEAFAKAKANGATIADLAARFGETERVIRQRLALGELHPEIRQAWVDEKIDWEAATAFSMLADQDAQVALYRRLAGSGDLRGYQVRNALSAGRAARAFGLITPEDYVARGGTITVDLFGANHIVSDPELAATMAQEVLLAEVDRLKADGWSFAMLRAEVKADWNYRTLDIEPVFTMEERAEIERHKATIAEIRGEGFPAGPGEECEDEADPFEDDEALHDAIEADDDGAGELLGQAEARIEEIEEAAAARGWWTAEQKAASGCFVEQNHKGELHVTYGKVAPGAPKVNVGEHTRSAPGQAASPTATEAAARPSIPDTLATALSEQRTAAAALSLRTNPHVALAAATLALEESFSDGPVKLTSRGAIEKKSHSLRQKDYAAALAGMCALSPVLLLARFTVAVGESLDMRVLSEKQTANVTFDAFLTQIGDARGFEEIAREKFDPGLFFDRVNGAIRQAAWAEMHSDLKAHPFPKGKKAEVVAACLAAQKTTGWLPPQLRFPGANS